MGILIVHRPYSGNSYISGGRGDDTLRGSRDNDSLFGNSGNDYLTGGHGENILSGYTGNDTLVSTGNDTLTGGSGQDVFAFFGGNRTAVLVTDFTAESDTFQFIKSEWETISYSDEESDYNQFFDYSGNFIADLDSLARQEGDDVVMNLIYTYVDTNDFFESRFTVTLEHLQLSELTAENFTVEYFY